MSELSPITGTEDMNGLFRTFDDQATTLRSEITLVFDEIADTSDELTDALYGMLVKVFRGDTQIAYTRFTDTSRSHLIEMLKSEEAIKQMIYVAVKEAVDKRMSTQGFSD